MPIELYTETEGVTFDGSLDPETEEDRHIYRLKGKVVPSVTQILKSCRMVNYDHVKKENLDYKSAIGQKVHEYTLWLDQDELDEEGMEQLKGFPVYYNRLLGWLDFCNDYDFQPDHSYSEKSMVVKVNGMLYAMKPDRYGTSNIGKAVVDIKSSTVILPAYDLQTAGYAIPFRSPENVVKRIIVQLLEKPVNGKYYRKHEAENPNDERIFLSCLAAVSWKINHKVEI